MVITICDNCKAETSAYPPARHKNHVPYCEACRKNTSEDVQDVRLPGRAARDECAHDGGKVGACMTPACTCKQFIDAAKPAPPKAAVPRAAKPGEHGATLFVAQPWTSSGSGRRCATDMNILNVCRLRAILEGSRRAATFQRGRR